VNKKLAAFYVILSGVLWGIISIFVNCLTDYHLSGAQIGFLRVLTCAVLMLIFLLIYDRSLLKICIKDIWVFVGTGIISLSLFSYCYFTTIVNIEASVAVSLLYTSPVFIMLFSALLFHEKITPKKTAAIVLTVVGCALISGMTGGAKIYFFPLLIGIGSGLFYGLYSIFGRYATKKYHPFTITLYTFVFAVIGFLLFTDPIQTLQTLVRSSRAVFIELVSGVLCGVLPYIFYTIGLKHLDATVAGILVAVEPLVGNVIGMIVFRESSGLGKIAGIVLILSSIILLNINSEIPHRKVNETQTNNMV